jgi:sulfur transfer complex TusBCD TusB component (DsrH family)
MKVLYLIKQDIDSTGQKIIDEQKQIADVTVIDLRTNKNYDEIVDLITSCDKVITW